MRALCRIELIGETLEPPVTVGDALLAACVLAVVLILL